MVFLRPRVAAASPGKEIRLAADGSGESFAVPLRGSVRSSGGTTFDRRSERRWIRAAQGGSEEALEELYRRHWPWAYRAAYLVVHDAAAAEDIAQEAFLAALRALDRFDRRRPLGPWLHRIVVNRAIDWSRARALRPETGTVPDGPAPDEDRGLGEDVVAALAALGHEHRAVVVLRHLLGYTPGEIATMLDLPRGTVNSRLRRALDSLAIALEER
jgi:RNA polymerase sigma-70 factor, ECF subfamily